MTQKESQFVSLADEEAVKEVIVDSILGLWKMVNNLTRLRPSKQEHYRVTIFGSARIKLGTYPYEQVKKLAKELASMGCDITTGGGSGLMQAANEGAEEADAKEQIRSTGIRVDLPFEQQVNPFVKEVYEHGTFFTRLHHFVLTSDAYVIVPGGIGTTLEAMMVWQLLQVGHIENVPLIFAGKMWRGLFDWAEAQFLKEEEPLINREDLKIPLCVDNADEAIAVLRQHHEKWKKEINR